jgi:hypothetical protein
MFYVNHKIIDLLARVLQTQAKYSTAEFDIKIRSKMGFKMRNLCHG